MEGGHGAGGTVHTWLRFVVERHCLFSQCLLLGLSARHLNATIVFGEGVPREAFSLPALWTELPVETCGGGSHLFIPAGLERTRGSLTSMEALVHLFSLIIISMCLKSWGTPKETFQCKMLTIGKWYYRWLQRLFLLLHLRLFCRLTPQGGQFTSAVCLVLFPISVTRLSV